MVLSLWDNSPRRLRSPVAARRMTFRLLSVDYRWIIDSLGNTSRPLPYQNPVTYRPGQSLDFEMTVEKEGSVP